MYQTVALPAATRPAPTGEALESELLRGVARRDHAAFARCYERHATAVAKAALGICRSAAIAEEIVQVTFVALWERAERLSAKEVRLRPWLLTVARNAAIDVLRAGGAAAIALDGAADATNPEPGPEATFLRAESADEIARAIGTLSPDQQAVVRAIYFDGMSAPEAAALLGAPLNTVKSRLRLALAHLRTRLAEHA